MKLISTILFLKCLFTISILLSFSDLNAQGISQAEFEYLRSDFDSLIIKEGSLQDGERHGIWTFRKELEVGTFLYLEGEYINGIRTGIWQTYHKNGKSEIITEFVNDTIYNLKYFDTAGKKVFEVNVKNGLNPLLSKQLFNIAFHVRYLKFNNMAYSPLSRKPRNNLENPDLECVDLIARIFVQEGETATIDYWNYFELLEESNIIEAKTRKQVKYKYNGHEVVFTTIHANGILIFTKKKDDDTQSITEVYYF